MKIVIEDVKTPVKIKEGDLIKYIPNDEIYIINGSPKGFLVSNLNYGSTNNVIYDTINELLENEFGYSDEYTVYSSSKYSLKLIEN